MLDQCPRCGAALKPGFVQSAGRSIFWTPHKKRGVMNLPMWEGEFSFTTGISWIAAKCPARYCGNCGLILIETKEEEST